MHAYIDVHLWRLFLYQWPLCKVGQNTFSCVINEIVSVKRNRVREKWRKIASTNGHKTDSDSQISRVMESCTCFCISNARMWTREYDVSNIPLRYYEASKHTCIFAMLDRRASLIYASNVRRWSWILFDKRYSIEESNNLHTMACGIVSCISKLPKLSSLWELRHRHPSIVRTNPCKAWST